MGGPLTAPLRTIPTASSPPPNDLANGIALQEAFAEIDATVSVGATGRGARGSRPLAVKSMHPRATHIESFCGEELHKAADLSDVDADAIIIIAHGKSHEGAQDMLEPILGREAECGDSQTYSGRTLGMEKEQRSALQSVTARFPAIEESTSIDPSVVGSAGPLGAGRDLIMTLL